MLRRLIRLFYLTKRLRQQMAAGNNREITKAAQTLNELNFLENDGESLDGIHIIEEDREFIGMQKILTIRLEYVQQKLGNNSIRRLKSYLKRVCDLRTRHQ